VVEVAVTGPESKASKHGRGASAGFTEVPNTPFDGPSPDLPKVRGMRWHPQVAAWWEQVRRMPHCVLWGPTDWLFALDLAYLKQDWWQQYSEGIVMSTKSTEIRRREDQLGTTAEARRKLLIRYVIPPCVEQSPAPAADQAIAAADPAGEASVTSLESRRRRLAG
jgi:hypothetical protein